MLFRSVVIAEQLLRPAREVLHQTLAHVIKMYGAPVEAILRDLVHVVARQAADVRACLYPLGGGQLGGGVDGAGGYLRQRSKTEDRQFP